MEKLALRGVLHGVDKIPDSWFEKVPGGFFKEKEGSKKGADSPDSPRQSKSNDKRGSKHHGDYDDEGYRSEGHGRRHQRGRGSFDEDDSLSGDERSRHKGGSSHGRRRSIDDDRRGNYDGHHRKQHKDASKANQERRNPYRRPDLQPRDPYYDRARPSTGGSDRSANRFSVGSSAAATPPYRPGSSATESPAMQSPTFSAAPPARSGSISNRYVPYANIYGQETPQSPPQPFSPPPTSSVRSPPPAPDNMYSPPVAPPPLGYQQNPYAQEAPTAADAGAGVAYGAQPGVYNQEQDPRWANGPDPYYSARLYNGYDKDDQPYPNPASPRRSSRRDYSPSDNSHDARTQDRRTRSERRPDDKSQSQGKSKSRVRETFDTSQRGLGYGAVGAVTGGLIGSEFGKGILPTAIGATIGALGANAFEAREKYVHPRSPQYARPPVQPPPPVTNRRKEGRRDSEYQRDGTFEKREGRRRSDQGYYSD